MNEQQMEQLTNLMKTTMINEFKQSIQPILMKDLQTTMKAEFKKLNLETVLQEHHNAIIALQEENATLKETIKHQNSRIEMVSRKNNLVIFGLPESENENPETLESIVLDLCSTKLGVNLVLEELNYVRRIGKKAPVNQLFTPESATNEMLQGTPGVSGTSGTRAKQRSRPVVISLLSFRKKMFLLSKGPLLKDSNLSISSDYDKPTQEKRKHLMAIRRKILLENENIPVKLRDNGLLINNRFFKFSSLCEKYGEPEFYNPEGTSGASDTNLKKRKITTATRTNFLKQFQFRSRSDSTGSLKLNI